MATSSITRSFGIDNDEDLEIFLNAIEASKNDPAPESKIKVRYLHAPEDMAEFWRRREELKNKQNINWDEVEMYLKKYVGMIVEVADTKDIIHIGNEFPNEFSGSKYTYSLKGSRAKAKANTVQGICEMIEIATDRRFRKNLKKKHSTDAARGW